MTAQEKEDTNESMTATRPFAYQAWSSGWMMGIGFGVLVMFVATELPNNFFERARFLLITAGVVAFVFGMMRMRSRGLLKMLFTRK